jgi:molybdenum cofactor sulfurtransferase
MLYLDYAGACLPNSKLLNLIHQQLLTQSFGNPHSSTKDTNFIDECRDLICKMCNTTTSEYTVLFTSGATESIRKIGEMFPFRHFLYTKANHNSVIGIRSYALSKNSSISVLNNELEISDELVTRTTKTTKDGKILIAFPAECNFSGRLYPLEQIEKVKEKYSNLYNEEVYVLLDAAKYCSTNFLDLSVFKPDFVPLSLYKIIGYPTGLGVLLIKKGSEHILQKEYYGGGTLDLNVAERLITVPRKDIIQKFEDGTIPYISIYEAFIGLKEYLKECEELRERCKQLVRYTINQLDKLYHSNSVKLIEMYYCEPSVVENRGSIISFNIKNEMNEYIGYKDVERMAALSNIKLRTGCFCNPGACSDYLKLSTEEVVENNKRGHTCWDQKDLIEGKPTGAVRISLGLQSTKEDIDKFIEWLTSTFISRTEKLTKTLTIPKVVEFWIYPIKSCPGLRVEEAEVTEYGFKYDRMFAIYDNKNKIISPQRNINMTKIIPRIKGDILILSNSKEGEEGDQCVIRIDTYTNDNINSVVNEWLSNVLEEEVKLIKNDSTSSNFSNTSPYLVINRRSLLDLNMRILNKNKWINKIPNIMGFKEYIINYNLLSTMITTVITEDRFRPNIVIDGIEEYEEDNIKEFTIGSIHFTNDKLCSRCYTTTINSVKQTRDPELEPMKTLLTYRKKIDGVMFGNLFYTVNINTKSNTKSDTKNKVLTLGEIENIKYK